LVAARDRAFGFCVEPPCIDIADIYSQIFLNSVNILASYFRNYLPFMEPEGSLSSLQDRASESSPVLVESAAHITHPIPVRPVYCSYNKTNQMH